MEYQRLTPYERFLGRPRHPTVKPFHQAWRIALAEFAATLIFVFLVSASVSSPTAASPNTDLASQQLITAMIQGFGIAAAIYFVASISGGQINPAVTLSLWLLGRLGFVQFLVNVIAQMLGAICGAALFLACVGRGLAGTLGATMLSPQMSIGGGFLLEFLMTFFLILVVLGTVVDGDDTSSQLAPLPIGFIVLACVMLAKPYTGGSLNPARSFGPAVAASGITHDVWTHHWIYWVAPLLGSAVATFLYRVLFLSDPGKRSFSNSSDSNANEIMTISV